MTADTPDVGLDGHLLDGVVDVPPRGLTVRLVRGAADKGGKERRGAARGAAERCVPHSVQAGFGREGRGVTVCILTIVVFLKPLLVNSKRVL